MWSNVSVRCEPGFIDKCSCKDAGKREIKTTTLCECEQAGGGRLVGRGLRATGGARSWSLFLPMAAVQQLLSSLPLDPVDEAEGLEHDEVHEALVADDPEDEVWPAEVEAPETK